MEKSAREIDEKILKSSVVIVDVEGTTTSISFVKDVLFPYATEKVGNFLAEKWEMEGVQEAVEGMRQQALDDVKGEVEGAVVIPDKDATKDEQIAGVASSLKWLISIDNKGTFLKKLSGLIWEQGYVAGDLKGHVYKDVQPALEAWRGMGKRVYIYSSGSVHAQRLLMRHSEVGDLSALFDGNFDTAVGHKQEVQSYTNIIKEIGCQAEEALFLTDVVKEAAAAREAGLNTVLLVREGNAPLGDEDLVAFCTAQSFQDLALLPSSTKRKQEPAEEELPPTKVAKTIPEGEEKLQIECDKTEKVENGAAVNENEACDDEAMEVDVADEKSEQESNDLPTKETKLDDPTVIDAKMEEIIVEVKSGEISVTETKSDDKLIVEAKSEDSTETKSDDKPIIDTETALDEPVTKTKSDDKPVTEITPKENSVVEPATEVKSDDAQSVVETKSGEVPALEIKSKEKSGTKSETNTTPAGETKSEDKMETLEETPAKESKSCDTDQPKIEETEAVVADDCNQKTDIDTKSSDKDQVPEIMETEEEVSKDKKCEKIEDVNIAAKKTKDVTDTLSLTDVANKDESVTCEKTENEKVIKNSEIVMDNNSTEKLLEKVEKSESKSETKKVEENDENKDSDAKENTDVKMDAEETVSEVPEKVVKPCEDMVEDVSENNVCSLKSVTMEEITSESELVTMETDIDDKLNELLGEEGVALEKECDEILSKVDEMTNKSLNSVKSFIEKAIAEKESAINEDSVTAEINEDKIDLDVASDLPTDDINGETLNNGKTSEMDNNEESVPVKSLPAAEKVDSSTIETTQSVDATEEEKSTNSKENISNSQETKANGENKECLNGKTTSDEVNGQSGEESPLLEQKVQNGTSQCDEDKDKTALNVEDRLKGTNGTTAEDVKSAEPTIEQMELKLKKVPTEDITASEQAIEQVAET